LKIRIEELKDKAKEISSQEPILLYETLHALSESGECSFPEPLSVHLNIVREFDHIRVTGRVETSIILGCSRCLSSFKKELDSPFTIFYMKDEGLGQDEDVELSDEDLITATYDSGEIDFTDEISQQVLLSIPIKPLCSEECMGLCPQCGIDLNDSQCSCNKNNKNIHFNALKEFKVKK
jgi:uncharacterized protein